MTIAILEFIKFMMSALLWFATTCIIIITLRSWQEIF